MNAFLGLFSLGGGEIFVVLFVILLLFGAKKIPEFAKGLGTGIKEFKKATREVTEEMHNAMEDNPAPPQKKITATPVATVEATPSAPQTTPGPKV